MDRQLRHAAARERVARRLKRLADRPLPFFLEQAPNSAKVFSLDSRSPSSRAWIRRISDCLRSSSAWSWASCTMRLISSSDRPLAGVTTILCSWPVARSLAVTCTIPLESMSKITSIWATPSGPAEFRPVRNGRAIYCTRRSRARPGARGSRPSSGCPRPS